MSEKKVFLNTVFVPISKIIQPGDLIRGKRIGNKGYPNIWRSSFQQRDLIYHYGGHTFAVEGFRITPENIDMFFEPVIASIQEYKL